LIRPDHERRQPPLFGWFLLSLPWGLDMRAIHEVDQSGAPGQGGADLAGANPSPSLDGPVDPAALGQLLFQPGAFIGQGSERGQQVLQIG
jgi:hypothetical protein